MNAKAQSLAAALRSHLEGREPEDLCVVLGGDGFLLRAISELEDGYTFLGLNAGRMGFMLNEVHDVVGVANKILAGDYRVRSVPRLKVETEAQSGERAIYAALNDAYLERMTGQTSHLRIVVDEVMVVERLACDGVILATAMGSTAYSFSAGGPACHPDLHLIQLTAICPHRPRLPPITLPPSAVVEVEVLDGHRRPTRVVVDGVDPAHIARIRVTEAARPVRMAWLPGHNPTLNLIRKLLF